MAEALGSHISASEALFAQTDVGSAAQNRRMLAERKMLLDACAAAVGLARLHLHEVCKIRSRACVEEDETLEDDTLEKETLEDNTLLQSAASVLQRYDELLLRARAIHARYEMKLAIHISGYQRQTLAVAYPKSLAALIGVPAGEDVMLVEFGGDTPAEEDGFRARVLALYSYGDAVADPTENLEDEHLKLFREEDGELTSYESEDELERRREREREMERVLELMRKRDYAWCNLTGTWNTIRGTEAVQLVPPGIGVVIVAYLFGQDDDGDGYLALWASHNGLSLYDDVAMNFAHARFVIVPLADAEFTVVVLDPTLLQLKEVYHRRPPWKHFDGRRLVFAEACDVRPSSVALGLRCLVTVLRRRRQASEGWEDDCAKIAAAVGVGNLWKCGLRKGLVRALAREVGGIDVDMNMDMPGITDTEARDAGLAGLLRAFCEGGAASEEEEEQERKEQKNRDVATILRAALKCTTDTDEDDADYWSTGKWPEFDDYNPKTKVHIDEDREFRSHLYLV